MGRISPGRIVGKNKPLFRRGFFITQNMSVSIRERIAGRSLRVPDGEGSTFVMGVNTLKRRPGLRTYIDLIADYGTGDLAFAEVTDRVHTIDPRGMIRSIDTVSVSPFSTVSTGFVVGQLALYGQNTRRKIIFSNTAPRGGEHLGNITWEGEDDQPFVFGILGNGVPVFAVHAGYNLSFVKDELIGLWRVNVANDGSQFRSRDYYPHSYHLYRQRLKTPPPKSQEL